MAEEQDYYGERRVVQYKLDHNKKQLEIAIKEGNTEKIHKLESNIKLYEEQLSKIDKVK